jgi:hypothetical protein
MLAVGVALVQMADLLLVAVALEDLVAVVAVQVLEILDQQLTTELLILAVEVVAQIHKHLLLVALVLSSSLTQAHNNLVVAQSHQVVETLSIHSLLVVY